MAFTVAAMRFRGRTQLMCAGANGLKDAQGRFSLKRLLKVILPRDALEARVLTTVAVVRLILMPLASMLLITALASAGILPKDPVCQLALMVEGAMPSAQNLVLLMQLRESTQPLAPRTAQLLLQLYTIAVIPITFWMTVFVGRLPVPLSAV